MYCLNMLTIAMELAHEDSSYQDMATKFFEHFVYIAEAMNAMGEGSSGYGTRPTVSIMTRCICQGLPAKCLLRCVRWWG